MKRTDVLVVVPTLEEEKSIGAFLENLKKSLKNKKFSVLLIDDSHNMRTVENAKISAKKLGISLRAHHRIGKRGKGSAISDGLKMVSKESVVVVIDADLQYDPKEIIPMIEKLESVDVVVSIRKREDSFHRQILSHGFVLLTKILFNLSFDTQSGLKVMKNEVARKIRIENSGWVWDVEFLYKIQKRGYTLGFHEIVFRKRAYGKSKIHPIKSTYEMFVDILRLAIDLRIKN